MVTIYQSIAGLANGNFSKAESDKNVERVKSYRKYFITTVQKLVKINHANLVKVYGATEDVLTHRFVLNMEELKGGDSCGMSLEIVIKKHRQSRDVIAKDLILKWLMQTISAISHLHKFTSIVHRNINPSNIFLMGEDRRHLKLGLPCMRTHEYVTISMMHYASLEQLKGSSPHFKDDFWSLGVVLFELATFELPFVAVLEEKPISRQNSLIKAIESQNWSVDIDTCHQVDEQLIILIKGMLQVNREDRFDTELILNHYFVKGDQDDTPADQDKKTPDQIPKMPRKAVVTATTPEVKKSRQDAEIASLSAPGLFGWVETPKEQRFINAAYCGHTHSVRKLIKSGNLKSLDVRDRSLGWYGSTALIFASEFGFDKIVEILIKKGADVELKDSRGVTPLIIASSNNHLGCVKFLVHLGHAEVENRNNETPSGTALLAATSQGHIDIVEFLLDGANANIEATNNSGSTALILASYYCHVEIVKALLARGADVNAERNNIPEDYRCKGKTALQVVGQHFTVSSGSAKTEIIRLLKNKGVKY